MATSDGASLYEPEQDVLASGMSYVGQADGLSVVNDSGSTKTMRKLMGGDKLEIVILGTHATSTGLKGIVQFFCKT